MRPILILVISVFCFCQIGNTQGYYWLGQKKKDWKKKLTLSVGPGVRMFFGDIQQPNSQFNKVKVAYQADLRYQFNSKWATSLQLGGRGYNGYREYPKPTGYAELSGNLWEFQLLAQYSLIPWEDFTRRQFTSRDPIAKWNAYVGLGAGGVQFNSSFTANYNISNSKIVSDYTQGASGFEFFVPIQFGVRHRFDPTWSIGFEMTFQKFFTDELDAVVQGAQDNMGTFMVKLGYSFRQKGRIRLR